MWVKASLGLPLQAIVRRLQSRPFLQLSPQVYASVQQASAHRFLQHSALPYVRDRCGTLSSCEGIELVAIAPHLWLCVIDVLGRAAHRPLNPCCLRPTAEAVAHVPCTQLPPSSTQSPPPVVPLCPPDNDALPVPPPVAVVASQL